MKIMLGSTPSMENKKWWDKGTIPFLDGSLTVSKWVTELAIKETKKKLSEEGDIAFNFFGNFSVKEVESGLITNQQVALIRSIKKTTNRYIYHFLKWYIPELKSIAIGSTIKHLNKKIIENVEVNIPSITKQRKIIDYLDKYDTLVNGATGLIPSQIEANNKQLQYYQNQIFNMLN